MSQDTTIDMFGDDTSMDAAKAIEAYGKIADPSLWEGNVGTLLRAVTWSLKGALGQERAEQLAPAVVMSTVDALGGHICYWPKAEELKRSLRDAQIATDHLDDGMPMDKLADKYKLTVQRLYAIIAKQKAVRRRDGPDMFGFGEGGKG